jgi:branched-chain amino acid transport system substrate-binding protein
MIGSVIAVTLVLSLMPTSSTAADPVEIEAILPLTGQAAFIGKASAEGLKAAENIVNKSGGIGGRPVKFVVADDQSNPQNDVQLANDLIAKHVAVIMGSALVANCLAMVPLMKNGPVLYCLSPALHPDPGSFVFSGGAAASDTVLVAIRYARQRGWTRIATINPTDATGQDADKSIAAALAEPGNQALQIVDQQHFNLTDVSVAAQIAHIQARNPQMVIAWASGTAIGTVFRAINDASYQVPVLTSQANATYAQMAQFANPPEGALLRRRAFDGTGPSAGPRHETSGRRVRCRTLPARRPPRSASDGVRSGLDRRRRLAQARTRRNGHAASRLHRGHP